MPMQHISRCRPVKKFAFKPQFDLLYIQFRIFTNNVKLQILDNRRRSLKLVKDLQRECHRHFLRMQLICFSLLLRASSGIRHKSCHDYESMLTPFHQEIWSSDKASATNVRHTSIQLAFSEFIKKKKNNLLFDWKMSWFVKYL